MSRYEKNVKQSIALLVTWIFIFFVVDALMPLFTVFVPKNYIQLGFSAMFLLLIAMLGYNIYEYFKFNSSDLKAVDKMDGHDFEYYCANLLKKNGFKDVKVTRGSGDFGVDILAKRGGISYAVQCKRYSKKVGVKAVQEALSGKQYYHCKKSMVLTNNFFTEPAYELARSTNIILWDRRMLAKLIKKQEPEEKVEQSNSTTVSKKVEPVQSPQRLQSPNNTVIDEDLLSDILKDSMNQIDNLS